MQTDLRQRYADVMQRLQGVCRSPQDWLRVVRVLELLAKDLARREQGQIAYKQNDVQE